MRSIFTPEYSADNGFPHFWSFLEHVLGGPLVRVAPKPPILHFFLMLFRLFPWYRLRLPNQTLRWGGGPRPPAGPSIHPILAHPGFYLFYFILFILFISIYFIYFPINTSAGMVGCPPPIPYGPACQGWAPGFETVDRNGM